MTCNLGYFLCRVFAISCKVAHVVATSSTSRIVSVPWIRSVMFGTRENTFFRFLSLSCLFSLAWDLLCFVFCNNVRCGI